jgi:ubiquitin C-terminal hydrolase
MDYNQGLENLGSTCALNSIIQIICRNNILRNIILNASIDDNTLTMQLKEIITILYIQKQSVSPNKFINFFYNTFSNIFNPNEQLDISELWFFISNKISDENSYKKDKIEINNINDDNYMSILKHNNFKFSLWLENIQGSYINIIECKNCNNKSYNFEPFIAIQLDISNNDNSSITEMLLNNLKIEEHKNEGWVCDKCNQKSDYIKMCKLWKIPNILCFIIKRFDNYKKNNNTIQSNKNLIFKKGSVYDLKDDVEYKISSIGLHHGILQGGHYNALINIDDKFILYDDNNINEINNIDEILFKSHLGYFYLYEKL